jgi:hypothetical protein
MRFAVYEKNNNSISYEENIMKLKVISSMISALLGGVLVVSNANAAFVTLPGAAGQPGCGVTSATSIRCAGAANVLADKTYIAANVQAGVYNLPSSLSLISKVDTNFVSAQDSKFAGTFSDYVFMDTTTNSVVIGSRLLFGPINGLRNLSEANDIFRYGYEGFKVEAGWTRLSSSDLRAYSIARSETGLKQGADVYNANVVGFRTDVNASEGNPQSGLYLIRTDATAFKVINNAIKVRQGGEEGQTPLSVSLSGYAPTKLESGITSGETVKTYGGSYTSNMNVGGNLSNEYGNAQYSGSISALNGSQINTKAGTTTTFNGSFNQQVGASLGGGGTFVFNGGYSPGNSPGSVTVNGDVVFGDANVALFEIGGLAQGTQYDHLTVNGNLTFGGTLQLSFIDGYTGNAGDTFDLFDFTSSSGAFSQIVVLSPLGNGFGYTYDGASGVLTVIPVPEPESYAMLALGLGVISVFSRRKKIR